MSEGTALLLSLAIEVPVALLCLRGALPRRALPDAALAALAATLITHPFCWDGILFLTPRSSYAMATTDVELAVVIVEAGIYGWVLPVSWTRALLTSAVANGASLGVGFLVAALLA